MKEIVALAVFLAITAPTVVFTLKKQIGASIAAVFFCFALVSGWAIANYDRIGGKAGIMSDVEFEQKLQEARVAAVEEVRRAAEEQKQLIGSLLAAVREAQQAVQVERKNVEVLTERLKRMDEGLKVVDKTAVERIERAEHARNQAGDIQRATAELALSLTRLVYFQMEARDEANAERVQAISNQIMDGLDNVVRAAIPDPGARERFINEVLNSLPPPQ